jgi:hypothetical protein
MFTYTIVELKLSNKKQSPWLWLLNTNNKKGMIHPKTVDEKTTIIVMVLTNQEKLKKNT